MTHPVTTTSSSPQWRARHDRTAVPMDRWGTDHWLVLSMLEDFNTLAGGAVTWDRLTLSRRNWSGLYWARSHHRIIPNGPDAADAFGLRVLDDDGNGTTMYGYCHADALADMVEQGLVAVKMPSADPDAGVYLTPFGRPVPDSPHPAAPLAAEDEERLMAYARYRLTRQGWDLGLLLREHRADGGDFRTFTAAGGAHGRCGRARATGLPCPDHPPHASRTNLPGPAEGSAVTMQVQENSTGHWREAHPPRTEWLPETRTAGTNWFRATYPRPTRAEAEAFLDTELDSRVDPDSAQYRLVEQITTFRVATSDERPTAPAEAVTVHPASHARALAEYVRQIHADVYEDAGQRTAEGVLRAVARIEEYAARIEESAAPECPAGRLPLGSAPIERCVVRGPHMVHETAKGQRWTRPTDDEEP